jgi:hypothetical protein
MDKNIEEWCVISLDGTDYFGLEPGNHLMGVVDGFDVVTSSIVRVMNDKTVKTKNGSTYTLGVPLSRYEQWKAQKNALMSELNKTAPEQTIREDLVD